MRIRFWLYLMFGVFSIAPLLFLGVWVHNAATNNEINRASQNQLQLASAQAETVNWFITSAKNQFETLTFGSLGTSGNDAIIAIPEPFDALMVVDTITGKITSRFERNRKTTAFPKSESILSKQQLSAIKSAVPFKGAGISPLAKSPNGKDVIYLVRQSGRALFMGEISASKLSEIIYKNHSLSDFDSIIVNEEGIVISAAPGSLLKINESLDLVNAMPVSGKTQNRVFRIKLKGEETDSIAASANIPSTDWTLIVPQKINNIVSKSAFAKRSVSTIFVFILASVLIGSIFLANLISGPIEKLIAALRKTEDGAMPNALEVSKSAFVATEHIELETTFNEMVSNLRNTHRQMTEIAYCDHVTGLPNREAFRKVTEDTLAQLANKRMAGAMVFIDIDNIKEINDTHGHRTGDQVLRSLGSRISGIVEVLTGENPYAIPYKDTHNVGSNLIKASIASFGGNEFVLFIPENRSLSQLDEMMHQILEAISAPIQGLESSIELSGSIGIAVFPEHGLTYADLVKRADIAMYHAKQSQKGSIKKFGDGTGDVTAAEIRRDVRSAIVNEELELYYQPKIDVLTNEVTSLEALIRWIHPVKGIINPADFIPAIENCDTTNELGEWVIRQACKDMKKWDAMGETFDIAINISARQFSSENFTNRLSMIVNEESCQPTRFEIEVTEETALSSDQSASDIIGRLHAKGFRVSLDDYGRGYSNLTRLSELRVNTIKIDGPLTARLTRDERTKVIFEATINMARGLNCKTVAEGVETAEEVAILTKLGCSQLQGYYFATPLPFNGLTEWIALRQTSTAKELQRHLAKAV